MTATPQYFSLVVIPHTTEPHMFVATIAHPNGDIGSVFKLSQRELEQWQLELTAAVINASTLGENLKCLTSSPASSPTEPGQWHKSETS